MPKKACCCDPKGRHVAVACRYYGGHALRYVPDGATASAGFSGSTGQPRYVGPDGFTIKTSGYQRLFGITSSISNSENSMNIIIRGPYKWNVNIIEFDSSRDLVLLLRSGGGSSQYEWNEPNNPPKGGHSALLQTRVKASLNIEGFVGAGGTLFGGGQGSAVGQILNNPFNPNTVAGGGGGGGVLGRGGHGGITNGITGFGSEGGGAGSQTAGGCAGGIGACSGTEFIGGTGAPNSGWGGGGRYSGGGGAAQSGGGGGASKWPSGFDGFSGLNDILYSEPGSDKGPGGVCDPFLPYYTVEGDPFYSTTHAGLGGGANLVPDPGSPGPGDQTVFSGFGEDFNPQKEGVPGIIMSVWIDKYCPCDEAKTELPDKMYICLTDEQYTTIQEFYEDNPDTSELVKFDLNGETYIYFGICANAYCSSVRLVEGNPENLRFTALQAYAREPAGGLFMNDCCNAMVAYPICKIQTPDCFECSDTCTPCYPNTPKLKYCCENIDHLPDSYWSNYQGWLWGCVKTPFWFPFGITPEDYPLNVNVGIDLVEDIRIAFQTYGSNGFEKICLPVFGEGSPPLNLCFLNEDDEACEDLSCTVETGVLWENPHPIYMPKSITVDATICGIRKRTSLLSSADPLTCDCIEYGSQCINDTPCLEPRDVTIKYNSFCSNIPTVINGSYGDCVSFFGGGLNPNVFAQKQIIDVTALFPLLVKPILGMTIITPKCPAPTPYLPSFATLQATCGRNISVLDGFGLDLGTIASVLNQNPYGISYIANEPNIYPGSLSARYGAQVCADYPGDPETAIVPGDVAFPSDTITIDTSTSFTQQLYFRPRIYLYLIQFGSNGTGFSVTQTCNGAPCECAAPFYNSSTEIGDSKNCIWGYYNLVTMDEPVFAEGIGNESDGSCSIPDSILGRLVEDMIQLPYEGWPGVLQYGKEKAKCREYNNFCDFRLISENVSCNGKVKGNVG